MAISEGENKLQINNSLAEFLWFNEDVEVGFLELLSEHAEDIGGGREISQVVDNQVKQELQGHMNTHTHTKKNQHYHPQ